MDETDSSGNNYSYCILGCDSNIQKKACNFWYIPLHLRQWSDEGLTEHFSCVYHLSSVEADWMSCNIRWRKWFVKYLQNKATKHFVAENHELKIIIYKKKMYWLRWLHYATTKHFSLGFTHILLSSLFYVMLLLCLLTLILLTCRIGWARK